MNTIFTIKPKRPLLRRTQFLPGESLPSLLERLVQLNYYPSLRILRYICCDPLIRDDITCPSSVDTFLRLSDLTHISPEDLYAASNHHFATFLTLPGQLPADFLWVEENSKIGLPKSYLYSSLRTTSNARYCPYCLKAAGYHRLSWIPIAAAICLEHQCLLVSQCQKCQKQLSIQEIIRKQCKACLNDLSSAEPLSMEGDEVGFLSQQVIQSWFAVADIPELPCKYNLPDCHPIVLYRFLQNLSRCVLIRCEDLDILPAPLDGLSEHIVTRMQKRKNYQKQIQSVRSEEIFHLYKAAFVSITDWPSGLFRFLDAYIEYAAPRQQIIYQNKHLNTIRNAWFRSAWRNLDFEFAQRGLIDYLMVRDIPLPISLVEIFRNVTWFIERTGLCSTEYAASVLDISVQELLQFLSLGLLTSCLWKHSKSSVPIFKHEKLLTLKQEWKLGWTVEETRYWLGLNEKDVIELIDLNMLTVVNRPDSNKLHWLLSRQSVENFFEKVVTQLNLFEGDIYGILSLGETAEYFEYLGVHRSVLLQSVAEGSLPACKREARIHSLARVYFSREAILGFRDLFFSRQGKVSGSAFACEKRVS